MWSAKSLNKRVQQKFVKKKIGILTSSRADYSIYLHLLKTLVSDDIYVVEVIAFGTHLSAIHGYTINAIEADGFTVKSLDTLPEGDAPIDIAKAMAKTMQAFALFFSKNSYDLLFCLGDRYEMFAAVAASVPFNIRLAHIHGGEQTLGAIDDVFRHSITSMCHMHFTATEVYKNRVVQIKGSSNNVFNVGSLSIDNLKNLKLLTTEQFKEKFEIDLSKPTVLFTFHPETVALSKNQEYIQTICKVLAQIVDYQIVITMPNADTMGNIIRQQLILFANDRANVYIVESFGTLGYLSIMKHCSFMLGNTSSGFAEASFFPKYVINLGDRQKGRFETSNITTVPISEDLILNTINKFKNLTLPEKIVDYGFGDAAEQIVNRLKEML
jgi:GDP/UDP-N,N'-diacetylbacillosamine 2-epimerase (hydrolysing)